MNIILNADPESTITINIKRSVDGAKTESTEGTSGFLEGAELETKADDEINMDYSNCKGFDDNFMGFRTPLPALEKQLQRKAAKFVDDPNSFILKYHHFSTIQHAVRKMPMISAINIDGNPAKRKDDGERKDKWLRDNRIDLEVQLTDAFYKKSNFDKGHLARREDADWGRTEAEAYRNAQLTCMYTNACPQVPDLNRAVFGKHGLWGMLEQVILEEGVKNETGKSTKICVYNGPIFVSTDPVFKGVQIPLRFFKVIVWLNGKGEKKATAFVLSQEDLVGDIQFEELQYDEEFKEHQCSIPYLENLIDMKFTTIRDWDTFVPVKSGKNVKRIKLESLEEEVVKNSGNK